MNEKILKLLSKNARYTVEDLAVMAGLSEAEVKSEIAEMEKDGLIRGYKAVIDWERLDSAKVSAIIELKVEPQPDAGFEQIAEKIKEFGEVESVYLMSGGFDLCVIVKGRTFQEVAMFVARQLAPMQYVISTATHFILRRYKDMDIELIDGKTDDRETMLL
ncbi:MAG: Lrp/AsnC family transcriptional regulator [Ruminococcaceae bacterium]|nr:Lrp/AsnC family transcriptional regulator [Oscillospiraceae bacterium]